MSRVGVVALNTFREAVRDRVLYNLVFFALLMMAAAVLVGQISIGIEQIVIVNLGLSAISVIGLVDGGVHRRRTCLERDGQAHAVRVAGEAGAALGIFAREIRRAAADADDEYGGDGGGSVRRRCFM